MAAVLDGLISSRRRPSRSRSESGKQLHARWGDASITAPNGGGWSQHYLEDDLNNVIYQTHGSPDSQKTLVNDSPDLNNYKEDIEKVSIEEIRQSTPPVTQREQKERGAITITIPLPWKSKHRRSSSSGKQQAQAAYTVVDQIITAESRPALTSIHTNIDEVIVAESRPSSVEPYRAVSPIVHTQSPVYDDVNTFFTRAVFPEKHPGPRVLPQIQTQVPINKSQPASALSILSPVAEKYNGMSESNNATPMDNTPIAQHIATAIPIDTDGVIDVSALTSRLETYNRHRAPSLPPSRLATPIEGPTPVAERPESRGTLRFPSRPQSRGPGIGEVAYMRASSRGPAEGTGGRRSASRDPVGRRTPSVEPVRHRAMSRDTVRGRADSPRGMSGRSFSREIGVNRDKSREPISRRAISREPAVMAEKPEAPLPLEALGLSIEPVRPRAESPGPATRRTHSREPSVRRELSPVGFSRRAISREPATRRRISGEFTRRAMSVDPVRRKASPREEVIPIIPRRGTPLLALHKKNDSDNSSADELTSDADAENTDIETETDEMYFESRRGWNGPAVAVGVASKGFYDDVINDYKLIAKDVEAEQTQGSSGTTPKPAIVATFSATEGDVVNLKKMELAAVEMSRKYRGPTLVPSHEELWG